MRLVIARCSVDYVGRLTAHLPLATRVLMVKADGSVLVQSDDGSTLRRGSPKDDAYWQDITKDR